jgi:hypothetical protein
VRKCILQSLQFADRCILETVKRQHIARLPTLHNRGGLIFVQLARQATTSIGNVVVLMALHTAHGRLTSEALGAFEEAARDLDVEGSGWTAAETHAALEASLAAHVHELTQRKVPDVDISAPVAHVQQGSSSRLYFIVHAACHLLSTNLGADGRTQALGCSLCGGMRHRSSSSGISHRCRSLQVAAVLKEAEARLAEAVTGAAVALLDSAPADFWPRAQRLHQTAVAAANEVLHATALGRSSVYLRAQTCASRCAADTPVSDCEPRPLR